MEKKTAIPSLHSLLDLNSLVSSVNDSNVDFSRVCLLFPQEIIDPRLNPGAQAGGWKTLSSEPVLYFLGSAPFMTAITNKATFPNVFIVEDTNFVHLAETIFASDKRLSFKDIILLLHKFCFLDKSARHDTHS